MTPDQLTALAARLRDHAAMHESIVPHDDEQRQWHDDLLDAAEYLRQCAQAEPVAWMMVNPTTLPGHRSLHWKPQTEWHITWESVPLYTAPQPARKPMPAYAGEQCTSRVNNLETVPPSGVELAHESIDAALIVAAVNALPALLDEIERLRRVEFAFNEWIEKTEWVQTTTEARELGKHRADVLRERIERLREELNAAYGLLPGPYYMDPPDGGSVEPLEQLRRMAEDAERFVWWFSFDKDPEFVNDYLRLMRESASLDQWRSAIDAARRKS